jgi:hypothetical protein
MTRRVKWLTGACAAVAAFVVIVAVVIIRYKPSLTTDLEWSIGIYQGLSPFEISDRAPVANPVLTRKHISDVAASFVADPFVIRNRSGWYLFFEVLDSVSGRGKIGLATSNDGLHWSYERIVLEEGFHLSYPCVFEHGGTYYMVPESAEAGGIRLYRATSFPSAWTFDRSLVEGDFVDTSVIQHNGLWWLFTCSKARPGDLELYHADSLFGPWTRHAASPVVRGDATVARSGGRLTSYQGSVIRYTQDCKRTYGKAVRAFRVTRLSRTEYAEERVLPRPVIAAHGTGWARHGMHHVDPTPVDGGGWLAAVDGYKKHLVLRLEY